MKNQLLLKHNGKSKLHTLTVFLILLFLPVFLFAIGRYAYPNDSTAYALLGFGAFVFGGTILVVRKSFIEGLSFSPNYVLDNLGITLRSGKTLRWSNFEKAVVFFIEKEKYIGFEFKNTYRDFDVRELASGVSSGMISKAAGLPFTFQIDTFTEPEEMILGFVNKRLPVETSTEPIKLDEKAFEDIFKL